MTRGGIVDSYLVELRTLLGGYVSVIEPPVLHVVVSQVAVRLTQFVIRQLQHDKAAFQVKSSPGSR